VISLLNTGDAFFNSFTAPLVGSLLDWRWDGVIINNIHHFNIADYHIALAIVPLYSLIAFLLLFWMRETFCQQQA
ncbi:MAG: MFS transporter, partial [Gammaproteobacteria bacterium]|nr:MFS transporter [Gammaproteobacteria bacterium]